ncbi:MAG: PAAR domain-containing protein [Gammaproteobacteria bacterium]
MQPFIVAGDKTSHGGTVLQGSPFSDCEGKPIARIGDMVACPKCKGVFPIAEGDQSTIIDGAAVAFHGCKTACGATIIAGQMTTLTNPGPGAASSVASDTTLDEPGPRYGAVGAGLAATYEESSTNDGIHFRGRFRLIDDETGSPITGRKVWFGISGDNLAEASTDEQGYTQWLERDQAHALEFTFDEKA